MIRTVLVTGGAGFIGSHLADELLARGYAVRALDVLDPQVHGPKRERPAYLDRRVELQIGDVREPKCVRKALAGVDAVVHLAAAVGVGQSMYEIAHYTSVNDVGTAVLLEALPKATVRKFLVASSMSVYGEGAYVDEQGTSQPAADRTRERLAARQWEPVSETGSALVPMPTPETKPVALGSIYALSKYDQERMSLIMGQAYGIDTVALRFFNVYGPRQSLSNPYTGVLAIFASRLLNGRAPMIFEDGRQRRDFVSVHDVARACRLALEETRAAGQVLNIGSGKSMNVHEVALGMAKALGRPEIQPEVTGRYRVGDIRHCFADVSRARQLLGFEPTVQFEDGLRELAKWLEGQVAIDRVAQAREELAARGLQL